MDTTEEGSPPGPATVLEPRDLYRPRDGKMGFVNEELELVVPRQWDFAHPFENGLARVCSGCSIVYDEADSHGYLVGGAWGLIDRTGRIVVPVEHEWESLPAAPSSGP